MKTPLFFLDQPGGRAWEVAGWLTGRVRTGAPKGLVSRFRPHWGLWTVVRPHVPNMAWTQRCKQKRTGQTFSPKAGSVLRAL